MDAQIEFRLPSFPSNEIFSRLARNVPITLFSEIGFLASSSPSFTRVSCVSLFFGSVSLWLCQNGPVLFTSFLVHSSSRLCHLLTLLLPPPFLFPSFFFTLSLVWLSDLSGCNLALHPLFLSLFSISTSFQALSALAPLPKAC